MSSLVPGINQAVFWKLLIRDGGSFSVLFLVVLNHWILSLPVKLFTLVTLILPQVSMIPIFCKIQVLSSVLPLELKTPCGFSGTTEYDQNFSGLDQNKKWIDACAIKYIPHFIVSVKISGILISILSLEVIWISGFEDNLELYTEDHKNEKSKSCISIP